ncbi:LOB domain-containing protein 2 [Neltuma alba]|uniref:LOB domain-containing protein 2 n=1 Tax=Neltuma alba TaxID=207710 RepID=UPI0010A55CF4|nr:LOB domain-containing protein 2 [Prosopis alba]
MSRSDISIAMQGNKNETHAACAACKHQRKKCSMHCALAPYFPANRNREFQAVHKVFGVSNITKLVKYVKEEHRRKVVESLIWEAFCRQQDPILGSYGQYKKVYDQYTKLLQQFHHHHHNNITNVPKDHLHHQLPSSHNHQSQNHQVMINNNGERSSVEDGLEFIHHQDYSHKNNMILDSALYGLDFSQFDGFKSEVVLNQFQQHHPPYYCSSGQQFK